MADRYWVGGTGTWDGGVLSKWSTTSGGAGGASTPTSTDNVFFDANSGTVTVTISGSRVCNNLTCTGFTGTITGASSPILSFYGNVTFSTGMALSLVSFRKRGASVSTFVSSGKSIPNLEINSADGTLTLGDALTVPGALTITAGTFNTNDYNVTPQYLFSNNSGIRVINLGSSTLTLSGSATALDLTTTTNLTLNSGTSSIIITNVSGNIRTGGGLIFNDVSFTSTTWNGNEVFISGSNTFNDLSITGRTTIGISSFLLDADQTISGTLTLSAGSTSSMRTFLRSDTIGTTRTLDCGSVSAADIDFRDIAIVGIAAPVSGTRLSDCKGNSGITFDAPKTVYWRATSGASWGASTSSWSLTAGGTATHAAFPLAQDTAVFTATYPSTGNITLNASYNIGSIDWSARTVSNISLTTSTFTPVIYGNWIGGSGLTNSGTGQITFSGRGSQTISCVGIPFTQGITVGSPGGSVTLLDAFSTSRSAAGALTVTEGTFDANNYNVTLSGSLGTFISNASTARTVAIGSGTWTIVASSTTAWNVTTATNLTVTGTGTITLTSASAKTFIGGGIQTYPTINQGGPGALTITGSNKFANITNTVVSTVRFAGGTTNEFSAFNLNGTSTAARLTLGSTNTTQAILKKPTTWNVGKGSLDSGNNTGLSFTAGTNDFLAISYINGQISIPAVTYNGNFFMFF